MIVASLQYDPKLGQVNENIETADKLLAAASLPASLDLLVLCELAFTGYNFPDLETITPFLEPTTAGVSTQWAIKTAKRLKCHVIVGYPEVSSEIDDNGQAINYNSTVTVGPDGSILATYRKSFLYYTDEVWASEGSGFFCGNVGSLGTISHGICMDINPYQFESPWEAYEFANHSIQGKAPLVVISTAWLTHTPLALLQGQPQLPDAEALAYWYSRMLPLTKLIDAEPITVVFANRCGTEANSRPFLTKKGTLIDFGESVNYAGSSCVMRFSSGEVDLLGILGAGEEGLLVVDTAKVGECVQDLIERC